MEELSHFIDGEWHFGMGAPLNTTNPSTQESLFSGRHAGENEVDAAVKSGKAAFSTWSNLPFSDRCKAVEAFENQLTIHKKSLSEIISRETGKPLWESAQEVDSMCNKVGISIAAHKERCPEKNVGELTVRHRPHGVIAVFGPFNFPGHLPNGHIVPALLAGNTMVFKPSELTPLTAKFITELWEKTGIPPGVFNLVQGGQHTGKLLASHPQIDGIFFTGSSQTGKILTELTFDSSKILALEMGGNNPLIIWEAADLKAAAYHTIRSAFISSGQRCTCARRLILSKTSPQTPHFLSILKEIILSLKIGAYTELPEPFMGPVISASAAKDLLNSQQELIGKGGLPLIEMTLLNPGGAFLTPGLIDATPISRREDREIFGPLLQLIYVSSFEEAIEEANHTAYGLSAALLSDNESLYRKFLHCIRAGVANWNTATTGASSTAPFGGIGISGNHRPGAYYAADYCSYPMASIESKTLILPEKTLPGVEI